MSQLYRGADLRKGAGVIRSVLIGSRVLESDGPGGPVHHFRFYVALPQSRL